MPAPTNVKCPGDVTGEDVARIQESTHLLVFYYVTGSFLHCIALMMANLVETVQYSEIPGRNIHYNRCSEMDEKITLV